MQLKQEIQNYFKGPEYISFTWANPPERIEMLTLDICHQEYLCTIIFKKWFLKK